MKHSKKNARTHDEQLVRQVGFALICKIGLIVCLGFLFFGSDNRITTNADVVGNALLAPSSSSAPTTKHSE